MGKRSLRVRLETARLHIMASKGQDFGAKAGGRGSDFHGDGKGYGGEYGGRQLDAGRDAMGSMEGIRADAAAEQSVSQSPPRPSGGVA